MKKLALLFLAFICAIQVTAAPAETGSAKAQKWGLVPVLISNAETGVQVGALVIRFLNPGDTLNKPSTIGFAARVSQKKQVKVNIFPEWYLQKNLYHIESELFYIRWPADFYGIGNDADIPKDSADSYLAEGVTGNLSVERQVLPGFSFGPQILFNYENVKAKGTPRIFTDTVSGNKGGLASGIGAIMTYDKRDATNWARRGSYLRSSAAYYRAAWGSEFNFDAYSFEARQFLPIMETGALGFAGTLLVKEGNTPFRELATADGDQLMRGLVRGKYRDQNLLVLQTEYKSYLPDWNWLSHPWVKGRLGGAIFAEAGQVAHSLADLSFDQFRPGFGFGMRYALNPEQRMNIRVDIGFVDGGIAPAINIKEAF